jgi:hypothetical protein
MMIINRMMTKVASVTVGIILMLMNQLNAACAAELMDEHDGIPEGGTKYPHFIAMNDTMTCVGDKHATPFNQQVRGVNLGQCKLLFIYSILFHPCPVSSHQNFVSILRMNFQI